MFRARRFAFAVATLLVSLAATLPASAQNYEVSDVRAQASAADAVEAQVLAIEKGQRDGLRTLLRQLAGDGAPGVSGLSIQDYVVSFEVLSEEVGPTSYGATLAVTYDRRAVDQLLNRGGSGGTTVAREELPPAVVVPVWETGAGTRLWEADNAWKQAWDQAVDNNAVARFVVPLGDLQDLAAVDAQRALQGDQAALQNLAQRYGADTVVVARLVGDGTPDGPLEVRASGYGAALTEPYSAVVPRDASGSLETSLASAVRAMQGVYDRRAREGAAAKGPTAAVAVTAPVTSLDEWGRLLRYLEGLRGVEVTRVREFSRTEAKVDLRVQGGADALNTELARGGWSLRQDGAGGWRLQQGAAPSGAAPTAAPGSELYVPSSTL